MESTELDLATVSDSLCCQREERKRLDKNPKIKDYILIAMDPQLSKLDPKVAETFHRVMNTPIPAAPPPTSQPVVTITAPIQPTIQPQVAPVAPTQPPQQNVVTTTPSAPMPNVAAPLPTTEPHQTEPPKKEEIVNVTAQHEQIKAANSQVFNGKKKVGKISPIIIVLGAIVLLVVYTLVWVKIFNVALPFLP